MTGSVAAPDAGAVRLTHSGQVATITLDRPNKRNALTPEMLDQLDETIAKIRASDARAVAVRATGDQAFCVGADITRFAGSTPVQMWRDWNAHGHRVFDALGRLAQPSVAVVHATALGGGLELALACDFRVVAANAQLGLPEVGLGTVPGWGGTGRLTEVVGRARAKEIVLARRLIDGTTAHTWGLATSSAARVNIDDATEELLTRLTSGAPVAVQLAKQIIDAAADGGSSRTLEALAGGVAAATEDLGEGVAAFRERREATFKGR